MRIASLLPSATEIVYALGVGDRLVGRSPECDFPPEVAAKPVVSSSVFDGTAMGIAEIDGTVRAHMGGPGGFGSLYHIDVERLRQARPDLILTQALCDVCAASLDDVRAVAGKLERPPEVVSLDPSSIEGILGTIRMIGEKTGRGAQAEANVEGLQRRLDAVRHTLEGARRPRVACLEWLDPLFSAGHWVPEQVAVAGGEEGLGSPGKPSRAVDWERVITYAPDVLVLMPCGFEVPRALKEVSRITRREGFASVPAVRKGRVFVVNGSAYFNRPGPRTVDGVELLAHLFHPDRFPKPWPDDAVRRLT